MSEQTCRDCVHLRQQQPDPNNLGAPASYECRGGPPQVLAIPTRQGVGMAVQYPPLTPEFPACGQFRARLTLLEGGA